MMRKALILLTAICGLAAPVFLVGCGNSNPSSNPDDSGTQITAYILTVNAAGTGSGDVTKRVGGTATSDTSFDSGTVVTLTAQAHPGSTFGGWSGAGCSGTGTCNVTMTEARTLTAVFTSIGGGMPQTYTLTLSASPEECASNLTGGGTYDAGVMVEISVTPSKGCVFTGWTLEGMVYPYYNQYEMNASVYMIENINLTANFTGTAIFDLSLSASPEECASNLTGGGRYYGGEAIANISVTTAGYCTFTEWTPAAGIANPKARNTSVSMTQDRNLIANFITGVWRMYCVTYNLNGGGGSWPSGNIFCVDAGGSITLADGSGFFFVGSSGQRFGGWNTDRSGTGTNYNAGEEFVPTTDTILYARWTDLPYTITYNINGGIGTTPPARTVNVGSSVGLADGSGFSRAGYTFAGWNTDSSGTGTNYSAGVSFRPSGTSDNITLYARWTIAQYTVSYDLNGGNGSAPPQTVNAGNSMRLVDGSGFSRTGYTFVAWNTNSFGTGANYGAGASFTPSGTLTSITLYAMWNQTGTISGTDIVDSRDGKRYRTVVIGGQRWMAENLNYSGSNNNIGECYNGLQSNCVTYGRLYNWATVMNLSSSCNSNSCASQVRSPHHQGLCPNGWHVPSDAEWTALTDLVGSNSGMKLKSTTGWNGYATFDSGTDDFGFSALPGGNGVSDGGFDHIGYLGDWWNVTESNATNARARSMGFNHSSVVDWVSSKTERLSLRCVEN